MIRCPTKYKNLNNKKQIKINHKKDKVVKQRPLFLLINNKSIIFMMSLYSYQLIQIQVLYKVMAKFTKSNLPVFKNKDFSQSNRLKMTILLITNIENKIETQM